MLRRTDSLMHLAHKGARTGEPVTHYGATMCYEGRGCVAYGPFQPEHDNRLFLMGVWDCAFMEIVLTRDMGKQVMGMLTQPLKPERVVEVDNPPYTRATLFRWQIALTQGTEHLDPSAMVYIHDACTKGDPVRRMNVILDARLPRTLPKE